MPSKYATHCSVTTQWAPEKNQFHRQFLESFLARESHTLWRGFLPWYLTLRYPIAFLLLVITMNFLYKISVSLRSSIYVLSSFVSNQSHWTKEWDASGLFSPSRASSTEKRWKSGGPSVNPTETATPWGNSIPPPSSLIDMRFIPAGWVGLLKTLINVSLVPMQMKKQTRSLFTLKHVWTPDHHYVMRTVLHEGFTRVMLTKNEWCSQQNELHAHLCYQKCV